MGPARPRRIRAKNSNSKRRAQKPSKRYKALARDDATSGFEAAHSLLLSSLRYWEVERDLIEERIAALRSLAAPLRDRKAG